MHTGKDMSDQYFTVEKITDLVLNHNWRLEIDGNLFFLSQVDKPYMITAKFKLNAEELVQLYDNLSRSSTPRESLDE